MQVKKFEARSMQEALEMVKNTLGPDAIILNAKDNSKGFGLMGKQSIEVTAAISETQLLKKQWAESRLKQEELERLKNKSAKIQKHFIEKSVNRYQKQLDSEEKIHRPLTSRKYIDIDDEEESINQQRAQTQASQGKTVDTVLKELGAKKQFIETQKNEVEYSPSARVKNAAQSALRAFESVKEEVQEQKIKSQPALSEVQVLKNEIQQLKDLLQSMAKPSKQEHEFKLHPGAEYGVSYEMSGTYNKLTQAGIQVDHVLELLQKAKLEMGFENAIKQPLLEGWIAKNMMSQIKIKNTQNIKPIHLFFGPSGGGKTSTLVKMATHYVLNKNKKVGILTCDTEKVGAVEQLRIYAQILNIPFGIIKTKKDWLAVMESASRFDSIFIDYPGLSLKDKNQLDKLSDLLPMDENLCEKHLVLSSGLNYQDIQETTDRYRKINPTDVIFTKLDEAISHGSIYNFSKKYDIPLFAFGTGTQLPEDFEFATKERVIDLIFKITKFKNLNMKTEER